MDYELVRLTEFDTGLIPELIMMEAEAFGDGGLNHWTFPVFIKHGAVYIFKKDGAICGIADIIRDWFDPGLVFIVGFLVRKELRGKRLGSRFLGELLTALKRDGVRAVQLTVDDKNSRALELYKKAGFKNIAELSDEYGPGIDRMLLELGLEG
ncbi:MAG: GNAT family N-acetyltransferase [Actinomycetota bacterium]|nr:GNAT family N-acetyltransferase [Actinomycetota bacterium]